MAAGALALIALDGFAQARARSQLQQLADSAALAGVQALQDSVGQNEWQRRDAAVAATRAAMAPTGRSGPAIHVSLAPINVSVEVSQSSGWLRRINGRLDVVGQAGYLPPSRSDDAQQARLFNRLEWNVQTARAY